MFLAFASCKEKNTENLSQPEEISENIVSAEEAQNPMNTDQPREDKIKEAQDYPITRVALSEVNFDFGDVKQGEVVEHDFAITNTGSNPLIISRVQPGCGCTVPKYSKDPILPKQKGYITLKFDSRGFTGIQQKYAEVYTNTEKTPVILNFTANVVQ